MNRDQCVGTAKIAAGMLQQFAGLIIFSRALNRRGFETRIAGEAQKAIGDTHRVLRAYRRRQRAGKESALDLSAGVHFVENEPQGLR